VKKRAPYKPRPTDVAFDAACAKVGSIESYVTTGLREYAWPLTKLSLRVAQIRSAVRDKAASERLWTEENA